jgi:lipopolysaccharide transport system ATP-binding protein
MMLDNREIIVTVDAVSKVYEPVNRPFGLLSSIVFPNLKREAPSDTIKGFRALNQVSLQVRAGETLGIIGRNGSGKSTLLQIICGIIQPTNGDVSVKGKIAALLELGSGFNPEFTGRENVLFNGLLLGLTQEEINAKYESIVAFSEIGEFVNEPIKTYSSGMVLRLAFSVIAHVDADILVIDEALTVGDAFFTQKCMRFLREFMKKGTVLFVSHDTGAILNLCSRAIYLDAGEIVSDGQTKLVMEDYLNSSVFDGTVLDENTESTEFPKIESNPEYEDMRQDFINASSQRNDIEVFVFSEDSQQIGTGEANISEVSLFGENNKRLSWVVGGEDVSLFIKFNANRNIRSYIVGFQLKDRLGQVVFADNTYLTYRQQVLNLDLGKTAEAVFEFRMPIIPTGEYSIGIVVAEGTQEKNNVICWVHDALLLEAHASSIVHGHISVPMRNIYVSDNP